MTLKAVLLDLDDTLVHIDTELFTRRYIDLIGSFVAARFSTITADQFKKAVISATRQVSRDLDPMRLNQAVINASINAAVSVPTLQLDNAMVEFFDGPYRTLSSLAAPMTGGRQLIDWILAHNIILVIATNPLFPSQATYERMRWAELDPLHRGFALITTANNSHFTKPNIAYYSEILAKIGVDAAQALMVGDSFESDIQPALAAGMSTYWTMPNLSVADPAGADRFGRGSLPDLTAKLVTGWPPVNAIPSNGNPAQVMSRLTATVAALNSLSMRLYDNSVPRNISDWSTSDLPNPPALKSPSEVMVYWSLWEAEFNRPTLERIAEEDNPFISPPPLEITSRRARSIPELVHTFGTERGHTLFFLASLRPDDWNRPARDSVFGSTTLLDMANLIQRHDRQLLARLNELIRDREEQQQS